MTEPGQPYTLAVAGGVAVVVDPAPVEVVPPLVFDPQAANAKTSTTRNEPNANQVRR